MSEDDRSAIYRSFHQGPLAEQDAQNRIFAHTVLAIVREYVQPRSVLDVGCGAGTWLRAAQEAGIGDCRGIEGRWLDPTLLQVDRGLVSLHDLEEPFELGRRFDLLLCLELAEHLPARSADLLIACLVRHGDVILFSAAVPHQGGHHHVNEQLPDYWAAKFAEHGFRIVDAIRPRIWNDRSIWWWYRQNLLLAVHERLLETNAKLREQSMIARPLSVLHPDGFLPKLEQAAQHEGLLQFLGQGGTFTVSRAPDGNLTIHKHR